MTRTITLVITVVAAALVVVPLAASQSPDALERAVLARELSNRSDAVVLGDAFERAVEARQGQAPGVGVYPDAFERAIGTQVHGTPGDRSVEMNRRYGLGEFVATPKDVFERAAEAGTRPISGSSARSVGLNRLYGLGEFASLPMSDTHDRIAPISRPTSTPTVTSGRDLDWPQLGIGFGVGILLAAGLLLALRMTRIRPLAH